MPNGFDVGANFHEGVDNLREESMHRRADMGKPVAMTPHKAPPKPPVGAGFPVIAPKGELDCHNLEPLVERLCAAARTAPAVILDAQHITFGDSSFLRVLIRVHAITDLRIARPRPAMRRLFELVGLNHVLNIYASLDTAQQAPHSATPAP